MLKQQPALSTLLDLRNIERLAGARTFGRGKEYFGEGRVQSLAITGNSIIARVGGTDIYEVRLRVDGARLAFECSCPMGDNGVFCKHCVAAALEWRRRHGRLEQGRLAAEPLK